MSRKSKCLFFLMFSNSLSSFSWAFLCFIIWSIPEQKFLGRTKNYRNLQQPNLYLPPRTQYGSVVELRMRVQCVGQEWEFSTIWYRSSFPQEYSSSVLLRITNVRAPYLTPSHLSSLALGKTSMSLRFCKGTRGLGSIWRADAISTGLSLVKMGHRRGRKYLCGDGQSEWHVCSVGHLTTNCRWCHSGETYSLHGKKTCCSSPQWLGGRAGISWGRRYRTDWTERRSDLEVEGLFPQRWGHKTLSHVLLLSYSLCDSLAFRKWGAAGLSILLGIRGVWLRQVWI